MIRSRDTVIALAGIGSVVMPGTAKAAPPSASWPPPVLSCHATPTELAVAGTASQGAALRGGISGWSSRCDKKEDASLTLDGRPVPIDDDGRFLIGFGRDAPPTATLRLVYRGRPSGDQTILIAPRQWRIQSLPTLPKGTTPTPEFLARREPELARIAAARAVGSVSDGWRQRFIWPVTGRISGVFGSQRIYAGEPGAYHSGVDVARAPGTPVVAPADGVVVLAAEAPFTLEGNLLMIDHGMGLVSAFLHLSRIDVRPGDRVRQGQPIGAVGATGRATGPHLHWGMTWQDQRIDPALLAGAIPAG